MAKRTVDLVRHGRYHKPKGRLDELGIRQIECVAERVVGATHLQCSTMARAAHAGEIFAHVLELRLRRRHHLREALPSRPPTRYPNPSPVPERLIQSSFERLERLVHEYTRPCRGTDKHLVVAAHGNVIRYLWTRALGWPPDAWWHLGTPFHASVTRFEVLDDGWVVGRFYNDVRHLPDHDITVA